MIVVVYQDDGDIGYDSLEEAKLGIVDHILECEDAVKDIYDDESGQSYRYKFLVVLEEIAEEIIDQ